MTLNHVRRGAGEPVVLIHGIGSFWRMWEPILAPLAEEREVIAIDMPGFGESPPLPAGTPSTVGALTDAVAAFLEEAGIERPLVVGNSLGGWVTLELAKRGLPRAVVANSPAGFWSPAEALWCRAQLKLAVENARRFPELSRRIASSERARRLTYRVFYGHPERLPAAETVAAVKNLAASSGFEETRVLMCRNRFSGGAAVRGPVTVVWGDRDRLLFPRQAKRALAQIPQARLVRLAEGGHLPPWDVPDELARIVLAA
jgi:pimeloyl-ACP methyl ester carboxylesterase